jgi:hypothetical protein
MASVAGTLELLARELGTMLRGLADRLDEDGVTDLIGDLGLLLPEDVAAQGALSDAVAGAMSAAGQLQPALADLETAIAGDDVAAVAAAGAAVITRIAAVRDAIDDLRDGLDAAGTATGTLSPAERAAISAFAAQLPARLLDLLVVDNLEARLPAVLPALDLLGLVDRVAVAGGAGDGLEAPHVRQSLHLERFGDLVNDPAAFLRTTYDWGSPTFDGTALLTKLHVYIVEALQREAVLLTPPGVTPVLEAYVFALFVDDTGVPPALAGSLRFPAVQDYERTYDLGGPWRFTLVAKARFPEDVAIRIDPPFDATLTPPSGSVTLAATGTLGAAAMAEPLLLIGRAGGTRLEASSVSVTVGFTVEAGTAGVRGEPTISTVVKGGRLVVDVSEGDGFIESVLRGAKVDAPFEFAATWRPSTGLAIEGGAGVELRFPTRVELGPVTVDALFTRIGTSPAAPVEIGLGAAFTTRLGPLTATVDGIGTDLLFALPPDRRGNLGPVDLSARFRPPHGLGLSIDGGGFSGGGFLDFDPANERYAGVVELEFQELVSIKAIGLLTTRLPGGQPGFSLLLVISVEFTPIQLGFGFTLNGVGGLLGLNRTLKVERLQAGIRDNSIESTLFPTDVVANAARILSDLEAIYPPQADRFVFGPMAKLGWGTPTIMTITLGLIVEVPSPVRILLPGILKVAIPGGDLELLRIQVNFVGGVDFEQELLFLDASLFDSRLLAFPLSGDMALRLSWGNDPNLLLTVGGFHPAYQPPPAALPTLRRLTVQLLAGNNPRLTLETYFAVTSNTVQFGARIELHAEAGGFNVYGFLGFDVLFQFDPFHFLAEVKAMLALRRGSSSIASISLELTLEGPTPWKADGTAKLKLFWFLTIKVRFSKTFGEQRDTSLPDIEVLPLVAAALDAEANWRAEPPAGRHQLVTVRSLDASGTIVAHPFGVLSVAQKVVPLGLRIDRFGNRRPSGDDVFTIDNVTAGGQQLATTPVTDLFAPAQFFDRTDAEKLSSPSFQPYGAGVRIADSERLDSDHYTVRNVDFELTYIDSQRETAPAAVRFRPDLLAFDTLALAGAVAQSPISFATTRTSALAPGAAVVGAEAYHVVSVDDLTPVGVGAASSERGAIERMNAVLADRPGLRGRLQVVPAHEAVI